MTLVVPFTTTKSLYTPTFRLTSRHIRSHWEWSNCQRKTPPFHLQLPVARRPRTSPTAKQKCHFLGIESKTQCFVWSIAKQFEKKKYSTQMWTQRLRGEFNAVTVVPEDAPRPASYVTKFTKQQQQQIQNTSKSSKYQQCNECSWAPEEALRPSLGSTGRSVDLGLMLKSAEACNVQKLVEKLWRILKAS